MVIVKATAESEKEGALPDPQLLADMGKYNEELINAGILLALDGLHPSSKGARVKFSGKSRTVVDGPFAETKELIAGFWLWRVKSLEEAIEWVKRCPNPHAGDSEIEIRQIFEMEEFAPILSEEQIQHKVRLRAALKDLAAQITLVLPKMATSDGEQLSSDYANLVDEVAKPKPRTAMLEAFANAIAETAKMVGEVAEPVSAAVQAILACLPVS
jgi:hypothetical protein